MVVSEADNNYDVIVIGVGAMGAGICWRLARRGLSVLGLEQFAIAHDRGSSHGRSRVIRKAYFEDPRYVPLLHRTYEMWSALEDAAREKLVYRCGCLNLGPPDHPCIEGVQHSAKTHRLDHERLDAAEVHRRWPGIEPSPGDVGVFERDAGFLVPERCVTAMARQAEASGAEILTGSRVVRWSARHGRATVQTQAGQFACRQIVLSSGPWLANVLGVERGGDSGQADVSGLRLPLRVERQVQLWFEPNKRELFRVDALPAFIHFTGAETFYGIPELGDEGVKVARHHGGAITTADDIDRAVRPADEEAVRGYLRRHLPQADGRRIDGQVCMYTNTPDDHFIVDRHVAHDNVWIVGGFSGHGFKFAPVVGEIVTDLVTEGRTDHPIEFLRAGRLLS